MREIRIALVGGGRLDGEDPCPYLRVEPNLLRQRPGAPGARNRGRGDGRAGRKGGGRVWRPALDLELARRGRGSGCRYRRHRDSQQHAQGDGDRGGGGRQARLLRETARAQRGRDAGDGARGERRRGPQPRRAQLPAQPDPRRRPRHDPRRRARGHRPRKGQLQLRFPRRRGRAVHLAVRPRGGGERDPRRTSTCTSSASPSTWWDPSPRFSGGCRPSSRNATWWRTLRTGAAAAPRPASAGQSIRTTRCTCSATFENGCTGNLRHEPGRPRPQDRDQLRHRGPQGLHTLDLRPAERASVLYRERPRGPKRLQNASRPARAIPTTPTSSRLRTSAWGTTRSRRFEVRELVRAVTGEAVELWPDFSVAHRIQRYLRRYHPVRRRAALGGGERDPGVIPGGGAAERRSVPFKQMRGG